MWSHYENEAMKRSAQSWGRFLWVWLLFVWIAIAVGGAVTGAVWGATGFDCDEPARVVVEGPCPVSLDPTATQLASYAIGGAIRLGLASAYIGYAPAFLFAVSATALGWLLRKQDSSRGARSALWIALLGGTGGSVVVLLRSDVAGDLYFWVGLLVVFGLVATGIEHADRLAGGPFPTAPVTDSGP